MATDKNILTTLKIILQDITPPEDVYANLKLVSEILAYPRLKKEKTLFRKKIANGKIGLRDFVRLLIKHQMREGKINGKLLKESRVKKLLPSNYELYWIPERSRSSTVVHRKDEHRDKCPICLNELKKLNKRVWFWRDYYIFGNHDPIVENHLMVVYKKHGAQTMTKKFIEDLIDLNSVFTEHRFYFNRPGSLDKHRHVQAFTGKFPVEDVKTIPIGNTGVKKLSPEYPATGFVVEGIDKLQVAHLTYKIMKLCASKQKRGSEKFGPFYLVFVREENLIRIFIFPKSKWKADSFPGDLEKYRRTPENKKNEFVIIPASVETAGRGSTSDKSTFARMTMDAYCELLRQTSLPEEELTFIEETLLQEDNLSKLTK